MNNRVQALASNADRVWIGLTCINGTITSCTWDNGNHVTTATYTNFQNGKPDPTAGACTYMQVSNGKWFSAPCSNTPVWMGCQYTPGSSAVFHSFDKTSSYFNGKCYFEISSSNYDSASKMCKAACGTVASIHNDGSNSFVRDFTPGSQDSLLIGLTRNANKNYYWEDGTSYDYSNFGREDGTLGDCVSMSLKDTINVKRGQWTNAPCNLTTTSYVLCEKNIDNLCDQLATAPTQTPLTCNGVQMDDNSGTIFSPGFPRSSEKNSCEYRITQNGDRQAYVKFTDLSLDAQSTILLYNSFNDTDAPFATLTNLTNSTGYYYSTRSDLRIVYNTDGAPSSSGIPMNIFRADYGYYANSQCSSSATAYYNAASFSTVYYPNSYRVWCFFSSKKRIQVTFDDIMLYFPSSTLTVRDASGYLLQLSGGPLSNIVVTSNLDVVTVIFDANNEMARGFYGSFISID